MNEIYKKVDDCAHYVQLHAEEYPEMTTIIISSPNVEADEGVTLCSTTGTGANLIEMLATALTDNGNLLRFVKDAVALVEGARVMGQLARARQMQHEKKEGCERACHQRPQRCVPQPEEFLNHPTRLVLPGWQGWRLHRTLFPSLWSNQGGVFLNNH